MKITIEDNEQNLWKEENEAPDIFPLLKWYKKL